MKIVPLKGLIFAALLPVFGGCAKLAHLEELLCLKGLSENREGQKQFVIQQNENFDRLVQAVAAGEVQSGMKREVFLKKFGEPVFHRPVTVNGIEQEEWLYRYATKYSGAEKVYVYFSAEGKLLTWKHEAPPSEKV